MKYTLGRDRQSGNNIDVANGDLLDELSVLGEDLHAWTLTATVADHIFSRCADHRDLARVPKLTFFATYISVFITYLATSKSACVSLWQTTQWS